MIKKTKEKKSTMIILQVLQWAEKMGRRLMRSHGNQLSCHWDVTYK